MIKFGIKAGIAGGAIYYMSEQGLWKNGDEAVRLCNKISETTAPVTSEIRKQIPFEIPSLPSNNRTSFVAMHYWNSGVLATCYFLKHLPEQMSSFAWQGYVKVMQSINASTGNETNTKAN